MYPFPGTVAARPKRPPARVVPMALACPFCTSDAVIVERRAGHGTVSCFACSSLAPAEMMSV